MPQSYTLEFKKKIFIEKLEEGLGWDGLSGRQ